MPRADARVLGCTEPRLFTPPLRELTPKTSRGFEVIAFAEDVLGVTLTPWQKWLYIHALELDPDGGYRFRTLVILIARQNGKTLWLQILALWALYVDEVMLVLGTAQNLDIAEECWQGSVDIAEGVPELAAEIASVDRTNGKKALVLQAGQRYKVAAASRRGGRGLSGDLVALDELREHQTWDAWASITKTTMARANALVVGLSNAGDVKSVVLSHLRDLALQALQEGEAGSLGLFEWSAPDDCPLDDIEGWRQANPSMGYTDLSAESIRGALETDPEAVFRTEILCQWVDQLEPPVFPLEHWAACRDEAFAVPDGAATVFAVDQSWDRDVWHLAIAAAVPGSKTRLVDVVLSTYDPNDIFRWFAEGGRMQRFAPYTIALQDKGAPVSPMAQDLGRLGIHVTLMNGGDVARGCGNFHDSVKAETIRHAGRADVEQQVQVAVSRPLGDAWALDRKKSPVDIAGLVAMTEALWVLDQLITAADYDLSASVH